MGASCSGAEVSEEQKQARKKNRKIEMELRADFKRFADEAKVLLLGTAAPCCWPPC